MAAVPAPGRGGLLAGAAVVAALASAPAGAAESTAQRSCLAAVHGGLRAVVAARQQDARDCLADAAAGALGALSVEECLAADRTGAAAAAAAAALAAEAAACDAGALPDFGYRGAAAALDAAAASGGALAHGLFGLDLDAAPAEAAADPAGARCQAAVLRAAGRCIDRFLAAFARCARRSLRRGAADAFDLVACKDADPGACRGGIRGAVRRACRRGDADALFPGCAGDPAACARGHARRTASLALNAADGLCENQLPGGRDPETTARCFEPPPPEPVETTLVPLPDGVLPDSPFWDPNGEFLVLSFRSDAQDTLQLARLRPDGSDFACLTCGAGLVPPVRGLTPLEDGARVLVNSGNGAAPDWRILECAPSLADCQSAEIVPIELPPNPDPANPIAQYRVPHVTRDGQHFVWTEVRSRGPGNFLAALGRLDREADRYVVRDARIIAPPIGTLDLGGDAALWERFTANYEAKEAQLRGGLDYVVAGTPEAGQYDDIAVELATGTVRRLSQHPDHDEGMDVSPDEQWYVMASAAGDERVEFLGLLPRPPYIDGIAFSIHFVGIAGQPGDASGNPGGSPAERDCYLTPFLLDRWGQRRDYVGQRLLAPGSDGFEPSPGVAWHPDGTRLLLMESRWKRLTPAGEKPATRLRLARLVARAPLDPSAVVPAAPTPDPLWAVRYEDWIIPDTEGVTVIPGEVSGTATLVNELPSVVSGRIGVVYDHYSDDGERFLDGFERLTIPLLLGGADYEVDLRLRGALKGSMRGSIHYDFVNDVNVGQVKSRLGRRRIAGPRTCEEAGLLPPLDPGAGG